MDAKKKIKGKYNEDLTELPLFTDLNPVAPTLKHCDVCNQPIEKVEGSVYTKYRKLAKKATDDEEDTWETDYAWDYTNAKILPYPDKHVICARVRKIEGGSGLLADQLFRLAERVERSEWTFGRRLRNRVGALIHRIAEVVGH